jgi:dihydroflavonol-4-reductase
MRTLKLFKMVAERKFFYVGRGDAFVHFIDVRDLAQAFLLALKRTDLNGDVFIIAGHTALRLKTVVEYIASCFGVKPPSLHLPVRPMQLLGTACEILCKPLGIEPPIFRRRVDFFTKNRCFDTSKAQRVLGFTPSQNYQEEIQDIIRWYREHNFISVPFKHETHSTLQLKT